MPKGVLGNDPFQRAAAPRPAKQAQAEASAAPPLPANATDPVRPPGVGPDAAADAPRGPPSKTLAPSRKRTSRKAAAGVARPLQERAARPDHLAGERQAALRHPADSAPVAARIRASTPAAQPTLEAPSQGPQRAPSQPPPPTPPIVDRALTTAAFFRALLSQAVSGETVHRARQLLSTALSAITQSLGALGHPILDPYGKDPQLVARLEPLLRFLYEDYWRVEAHDAGRLPEGGAAILVANHSGAIPFDGPVLQRAILEARPQLPEPRWLVEDQIFDAPWVGTLFNRLGAVRASPENATRLLEEGRSVIVFPEGIHGMGKPFAERYQLKRFGRGGFVKLALRTGAPIVPVAIVGAEEAAPLVARLPPGMFGLDYVPITPLGPIPLPSKWMIRLGAPLRPDGSAEDAAAVERFTEQTRQEIDRMLQELLRRRRTIFAG